MQAGKCPLTTLWNTQYLVNAQPLDSTFISNLSLRWKRKCHANTRPHPPPPPPSPRSSPPPLVNTEKGWGNGRTLQWFSLLFVITLVHLCCGINYITMWSPCYICAAVSTISPCDHLATSVLRYQLYHHVITLLHLCCGINYITMWRTDHLCETWVDPCLYTHLPSQLSWNVNLEAPTSRRSSSKCSFPLMTAALKDLALKAARHRIVNLILSYRTVDKAGQLGQICSGRISICKGTLEDAFAHAALRPQTDRFPPPPCPDLSVASRSSVRSKLTSINSTNWKKKQTQQHEETWSCTVLCTITVHIAVGSAKNSVHPSFSKSQTSPNISLVFSVVIV